MTNKYIFAKNFRVKGVTLKNKLFGLVKLLALYYADDTLILSAADLQNAIN